VVEDVFPVRWAGRQAVVELPEHIGIANAGQVREELLSVINRGAVALIADMTATASCDYAGADALFRAFQRATASGTELRLVVTARLVSRVLAVVGLDRLVSIYPSMEAAGAASAAVAAGPAPMVRRRPQRRRRRLRTTLVPDAVVLADGDGIIAAASEELEDMFGYGPGELPGRPIESLMPDGLQAAPHRHRVAWAQKPAARPMTDGTPLAGLRRDGTTFPVRIGLTPVSTAAGHYTLTMIRAVAGPQAADGAVALAGDAAPAQGEHRELLGAVISSLHRAGLSLRAALDLPADAAGERVTLVLDELDGIIGGIRGSVFAARGRAALPPPGGTV
jgi:anti-anti-sigma factor